MKKVLIPILLVLTLIQGCCSTARLEDMRERAERAERELRESQQFTAGCQDDLGELQKRLIESQNEVQEWQAGSMLQALHEAKIRRGCDV